MTAADAGDAADEYRDRRCRRAAPQPCERQDVFVWTLCAFRGVGVSVTTLSRPFSQKKPVHVHVSMVLPEKLLTRDSPRNSAEHRPRRRLDIEVRARHRVIPVPDNVVKSKEMRRTTVARETSSTAAGRGSPSPTGEWLDDQARALSRLRPAVLACRGRLLLARPRRPSRSGRADPDLDHLPHDLRVRAGLPARRRSRRGARRPRRRGARRPAARPDQRRLVREHRQRRIEPVDDTKAAYPHAFVVLALSAATSPGGRARAHLLDEALAVITAHFWDDEAGRTHESLVA